MFKKIEVYSLLMSMLIATSAPALVTVGATPDCNYNNIEDAVENISTLDPIILVANDQEYTDDFTIDKQVLLYGGYNNCMDAVQGTLGDDFTQWRGSGETVIKIDVSEAIQAAVIIQRFHVNNGNGLAGFGGGIDVKGNVALLLYDSLVSDNQAVNGGGVSVSGTDAMVRLSNTNILFNEAQKGGGLHCSQNAQLIIEGNSGVKLNDVAISGGGIHATSECEVIIQRGNDAKLVLTQEPGISDNTADYGGGVAVVGGASITLNGEGAYPARITANSARFAGGVAVIDDGSSFTAINGVIDDNIAIEHSGGFFVSEPGATFSMRRGQSYSCFVGSRCSSLSGNTVSDPMGVAAVGTVSQDGAVEIAQTYINGNKADSQVVLRLFGEAMVRLEGNLIYDNKPSNGGVIPDSLFYVDNGSAGQFDFIYNTISNNINQATFRLSAVKQNRLNIFNSIVFNLGDVLDQENVENNFIQADCSIMHETATLTGNVGVISTSNPQFQDAVNHDFRLESGSVAVDMCEQSLFGGALYADLLGVPRGHDILAKPDLLGPYDAGAYESDGDLIFRSNFE